MHENLDEYNIVAGKLHGKMALGRPRYRCEYKNVMEKIINLGASWLVLYMKVTRDIKSQRVRWART
jgi:hypothetical protein